MNKNNFPRHTDYILLKLCTNRSIYTDESATCCIYILLATQLSWDTPDLHEWNLKLQPFDKCKYISITLPSDTSVGIRKWQWPTNLKTFNSSNLFCILFSCISRIIKVLQCTLPGKHFQDERMFHPGQEWARFLFNVWNSVTSHRTMKTTKLRALL